jgi:hypothetical protein
VTGVESLIQFRLLSVFSFIDVKSAVINFFFAIKTRGMG